MWLEEVLWWFSPWRVDADNFHEILVSVRLSINAHFKTHKCSLRSFNFPKEGWVFLDDHYESLPNLCLKSLCLL